jgi:hypothetical protein
MPWLAIAHHLPERTRLRCPMLRRNAAACTKLADVLADVPGVHEVRVRPYTGSALILHDAGVAIGALTEAASQALGGARVLAHGEVPPLSAAGPAFSSIRQKLIVIAREIDSNIRRSSDGSVDLGTLATLGFASAGAVQIAASEELPAPPWFNLAWWAYRMFMTTQNVGAPGGEVQPGPVDNGEAPPAPLP